MQKESTTSILVSAAKKNSSESKERSRAVKVATHPDNGSDLKLKSIQEEDAYHHADCTRSSTASSLDSTCSSPSNADLATHPAHKPSHHVTFAPMPPRHSTSPDHSTNYKRRSPSPSFVPQQSDSDYPVSVSAHHGMQRGAMPMHPVPMSGAYPRSYAVQGRVIQPPGYASQAMHRMRQAVPNTGMGMRTGPNPAPSPTELPKPVFPPGQRTPFGSEAYSGLGDTADIAGVYSGPGGLAQLAQLRQQQQLAQLAGRAMAGRQSLPAGLAAQFPSSGAVRFPSDVASMNSRPQMEPGSSSLNVEAWKRMQQQQQQQLHRAAQFGFADPAMPSKPGPDQANAPLHGMAYPPFSFNQPVPRNIFPNARPGHDGRDASSATSPTPASLGPAGVATSNVSPQAGSLPPQRNPNMPNRYPELDGVLSHMMAVRQQQSKQQGFPQSQQASNLFNQDRANDIFRASENAAIPTARPTGILPTDMFGMSPKSGGISQYGMSSIGQSPSGSSPSDPFPPYPLSQERQQIYEDSLDMLERSTANPATSQRAPASTVLSKPMPDKLRRKPFMGMPSEEDEEPYQLFPSTGYSWGLGRNNRNDNSLGLSNLGSIGSERAMAQSQVPGRYLWGETGAQQQQQQRPPQAAMSDSGGRFPGAEYQSLWSAPMMPSGPSTLEQLIRQQQEHAGHDKTPP